MAKGQKIKHQIDPRTLVIEKSLKQIRRPVKQSKSNQSQNHDDREVIEDNEIDLIDVWMIKIPAQQSPTIISWVKSELSEDPVDMSHLKRFFKILELQGNFAIDLKANDENSDEKSSEKRVDEIDDNFKNEKDTKAESNIGNYQDEKNGLAEKKINKKKEYNTNRPKVSLNCLLCSTKYITTKQQIFDRLQNTTLNGSSVAQRLEINNIEDIFVVKVPRDPPISKEEAKLWTEKYWPSIWKGDPNLQMLQQEEFNFTEIEQMFKEIVELANVQKAKRQLPIVTRIYDPIKKKVLATSHDERFKSPLNHSIVSCISQVAANEVQQRQTQRTDDGQESTPSLEKNYLCLNYHVYTTHEPCSFCCMALVHSRIGRLYYLKDSKRTGAVSPDSAKGYCIHQNKQLNWNFESYKWVKDTKLADEIPEISSNLFI